MIKTLFTLTLTLLLMVTLCLTVSAQSWEFSRSHSFGSFGSRDLPTNLEFSGKNVLFFTVDDRIYKWDLSIGRYWWKGVGSAIIALDIPEESPFYVAYLKEDGKVGMRYTSDLSWRRGFKCKYNNPYKLAVSANGDSLVVGAGQYGQYIERWDVSSRSARYKGRIRVASGRAIRSLAMSDSGNYIFAADRDHNTDKWSFRTGNHIGELRSGRRVKHVEYSDGILASWCADARIHLWDASSYRHLRTLLGATFLLSAPPSFSSNMSAPYLAARDGWTDEILIWNVQSGVRLDTIDDGPLAHGVALNSDGTLLASSNFKESTQIKIYRRVGAAAPAATPQAALPPAVTTLLSNYPNPFNPETWIPYQLATPAEVTVSIHAADGKLVRALALGQLPAGVYQDKERAAYWDGTNEQGEPVASGVYFYTLKAGDFSATKKMLIRK